MDGESFKILGLDIMETACNNENVTVFGLRIDNTGSPNTIQYCAQTALVQNPISCDGNVVTLDRRSLLKERT